MSDEPAIFVSHSSADGETARRLRVGLAAALETRGLRMLLDETHLGPGDLWKPILHRWLAECDGAIVLLAPVALTKPWVRKEATILAWRAALRPDLGVVPVLIDGVTPEQVEEAFPAVELEASQVVRVPANPTDEALAAVVAEIVERLPVGLSGDDDVRRWVRDVADQLGDVRPHAFAALVDQLDVADEPWRAPPERCRVVAHELHHVPTLDDVEGYVTPIVRDMRDRRYFVESVAPVGIPVDAAAPLIRAFARDPGRRVLALNGHEFETAVRYVERATCGNRYFESRQVAGPVPEDAVEHVCAAARGWLLASTGAGTERRIARQLAAIDRRGRRVLVLPLHNEECPDGLTRAVVRDVVARLCEELPHLVLLVLTGPDYAGVDDLWPDAVRVAPGPTDVDTELDENAVYRRLLEQAG
ncbi:toll/interleukin-1 receptor domain-containing protein [Actinomycetospora aeridis]|uniref:Toll/interleukin-1 receptor domain-containing protein n=1 Tax=Actinomycetospora aeridis TaxID=3129231 RepID=A0ABU8N281_9PSEU